MLPPRSRKAKSWLLVKCLKLLKVVHVTAVVRPTPCTVLSRKFDEAGGDQSDATGFIKLNALRLRVRGHACEAM